MEGHTKIALRSSRLLTPKAFANSSPGQRRRGSRIPVQDQRRRRLQIPAQGNAEEVREFQCRTNAEGVCKFQPRVARASALPWVLSNHLFTTLKGLSIDLISGHD